MPDGVSEWRRILEAGWAGAERIKAGGAADVLVADGPMTSSRRARAADGGSDGEGSEDGADSTMEISDEGDASALLAAVKERLAESGHSAQYHNFLAAISASTVDTEAALAILDGHDDLIAAFKKCFTPSLSEAPGRPPKEKIVTQDTRSAEVEGTSAHISQLVSLIFSGKTARAHERSKMTEYLKRRSKNSVFPRRLFILRGPPGVGKSLWAQQALRQEVETHVAKGEVLGARLAHVCSTDDFFMQFTHPTSSDMKYVFEQHKLNAYHIMNEARVRLAMAIGLEPLYIDNTCMRLWEMRPYVMLADRLGYSVTVVAPEEISASWNDLDFLKTRNEDPSRRNSDKYVAGPSLEAMLQCYEPLPASPDPRPSIRAAKRPLESDAGHHDADLSTLLPPSSMLYKLEKLMLEGTNIIRYTPPDGKGWALSGELGDEWHSFREKGDGACCYDDRQQWWTEDPEMGWSFAELSWLEELRGQAGQLPKADLPTATTHPALFVHKPTEPRVDIPRKAPKTVKKLAAPTAKVSAGAESAGASERAVAPAAVPVSRAERFRQRVREEVEAAEPVRLGKKAVRKRAAAPAPEDLQDEEDDESALPKGVPTENEEVSAATFLAAVKSRLTEWGKMDQYQEFVVALSGSVDAKAAVRILRGHDDLLKVFRRKFAPRADLVAIKAEIQQEDDAQEPHPPSQPPQAKTRKVAPSTPAPQPPTHSYDSPRPPPSTPRFQNVKHELVKSEVKMEDMPKPPSFDPHAPRPTVTIGDESEEEEVYGEASVAAAVQKGRDECIAELAKNIFRKERTANQGVRERIDMVRYAMRRAARPRFPRELFILRGAPGVGKTEYAVQQLHELVDLEAGEELASKLTHVCSTDDNFEQFTSDGATYKFESYRLESYCHRNEMRVRLAMEAGIHPIFVDDANMRLWEMRPYLMLADRLGYVTTVVEPHDICEKWDDLDFLVSANDTTERRRLGKVVPRGVVKALLDVFDPLPDLAEPLEAIRNSQRTAEPRVVEAVPVPPEVSDDMPRPSKIAKSDASIGGPRPSGAPAHNKQHGWMQVKTEAGAPAQKVPRTQYFQQASRPPAWR